MQLTVHTDISLRVLMYMGGKAKDSRLTIARLAEVFQVPKNHMIKIVNKLGKKGYLSNVRGKGGGVYLGKPPQEINISEVIRYMESNIEIVDCQKNACPFIGHCKLKCILNQATHLFFEHISQYTLADILVDQNVLDQLG